MACTLITSLNLCSCRTNNTVDDFHRFASARRSNLDGQTLANTMSMVPGLLSACIKDTSIKHMRLVSKEAGRLALTAVTSCRVNLGKGGEPPSPAQLATRLAGASLQKLDVYLTITSGPTSG